MHEKFLTRLISVIVGLYIVIVIGNTITGIINDAIDKVISQMDGTSATLLGILRFVLNFDGVLIISIVGFIIWLFIKWRKH